MVHLIQTHEEQFPTTPNNHLPKLELCGSAMDRPYGLMEVPQPLSASWGKCLLGTLRGSSVHGKDLLFLLLTSSGPHRSESFFGQTP
jgi:hypothetical protein